MKLDFESPEGLTQSAQSKHPGLDQTSLLGIDEDMTRGVGVWPTVLVYTTSAVLLTILHISLSYTYEPALGSDPKLTVFVKSKYVLSILIVLDSFITR